jgi:hypothetical protein
MSMHWPEMTLEQYEQAWREVGWEKTPEPDGLFHIAWIADDGFHAVDLWASPEAFQRFTERRLGPAIQRIGIQGQPAVTFAPAHAVFNPFVPMTGGRASRPAASRRPPAKRAAVAKKGAKKAPRRAKTARRGRKARR